MSLWISGIVFGFSAGFTPGPLMTLVVSETLRHGIREGVKVAVAPLITDLPIIGASVLILSQMAEVSVVIGVISLIGGGFLCWLGWDAIRFQGADIGAKDLMPHSLRKGMIANFLNPSPYLFWFSVGGPLLTDTATHGDWWGCFGFIIPFFFFLVGSKIVIALGVERSRQFLKSAHYIWSIRFLGVILMGFAGLFVKTGLSRMGAF